MNFSLRRCASGSRATRGDDPTPSLIPEPYPASAQSGPKDAAPSGPLSAEVYTVKRLPFAQTLPRNMAERAGVTQCARFLRQHGFTFAVEFSVTRNAARGL
jgi:hypothetical protein